MLNELTSSRYEGEMKDGWYHGKGRYYFPDGQIYEGDFVKGEFHGEGTIIYPNGGKYKARWERGKMLQGEYFFTDDLKYEPKGWNYCNDQDRRFYSEHLHGIRPSGTTQFTNDPDKLYTIPEGTYDVGNGYYDPIASIIYSYSGEIVRTPSEQEVEWIVAKCRYEPRKTIGPVSGESDKMILRVKAENKEKDGLNSH